MFISSHLPSAGLGIRERYSCLGYSVLGYSLILIFFEVRQMENQDPILNLKPSLRNSVKCILRILEEGTSLSSFKIRSTHTHTGSHRLVLEIGFFHNMLFILDTTAFKLFLSIL
jgi:hypothetical protein